MFVSAGYICTVFTHSRAAEACPDQKFRFNFHLSTHHINMLIEMIHLNPIKSIGIVKGEHEGMKKGAHKGAH